MEKVRNYYDYFVEGEGSEKDEDDDGAHGLKIPELESDEGFFEISGALRHSNPLLSRRIEDKVATFDALALPGGLISHYDELLACHSRAEKRLAPCKLQQHPDAIENNFSKERGAKQEKIGRTLSVGRDHRVSVREAEAPRYSGLIPVILKTSRIRLSRWTVETAP